jgi:acyl carrier protein
VKESQVRQAVLDIINDIALDEDVSAAKHDQPLREQLDLDSMDFLDIVMELKKRYKVEVPEKDYKELASIDSCVEYLMPHLAQ